MTDKVEFQYCYLVHSDNELYHHGVKGMHWGIRRYQDESGRLTPKGQERIAKLTKTNEKLIQKSIKMDFKSAKRHEKGEKAHTKHDSGFLGKRAVKKARKFEVKAEKFQDKSRKAKSIEDKLEYNRKAAKFQYKSSKKNQRAQWLIRKKGFGFRASFWMRRGDIYKKRADKARYELAQNKEYIHALKTPINQMSSQIELGKKIVGK